MEELFTHLPRIQRPPHRLKQHRDAWQPIGERAFGQGHAVMLQLLTEAVGGTAIEVFVQQDHRPYRHPQGALRDHARGGRRRHNTWDLRALTRLVVTRALDASNVGLDLDFDNVG